MNSSEPTLAKSSVKDRKAAIILVEFCEELRSGRKLRSIRTASYLETADS